jgi:hypothetical protein
MHVFMCMHQPMISQPLTDKIYILCETSRIASKSWEMHLSKGIYLCGAGFSGTLERCELNRRQNEAGVIMSCRNTPKPLKCYINISSVPLIIICTIYGIPLTAVKLCICRFWFWCLTVNICSYGTFHRSDCWVKLEVMHCWIDGLYCASVIFKYFQN